MESKHRDKTLDYLRGLAIIQVVFVHILYWLGIFSVGFFAIAKSFLLFEMPIFFFVTGAVNGLGKPQKYKTFCLKRIKGLLIPYYIYSVVCILISIVYYLVHNELSIKLIVKLLLSWIVPLDHQIMPLPYFTWAIWFIPVYIISIILFPVIKTAVLKFGGGIIITLIIVFACIEIVCRLINKSTNFEGYSTYLYTVLDIIQKTSFYLIFMGLGVLYPRIKNRSRKSMIIATTMLLVSIILLLSCKIIFGNTLNMQSNKFPPNHMFLFYSFIVLSLLYIVKPLINRVYLWMIRFIPILDKWILIFSQNSIYIFLYQTFSFWIISIVLKYIGFHNDYLVFVIALITVYPMIGLNIKLINRIQAIRKRI